MNTEQALINGFLKRASQYGYSELQAMQILKQATAADAPVAAMAPAPGLFNKVKGMFSKPAPAPAAPQESRAPVRQFGMTNNMLNSAQQGIEHNMQIPGI